MEKMFLRKMLAEMFFLYVLCQCVLKMNETKGQSTCILMVAFICCLFCCHLYVAFRMKTG